MELTTKQQITEAVNDWIDENNPERSGKKLADKAGMNISYISSIRNGKLDVNGSPIKDMYYLKVAEAIAFKLPDANLHFETELFLKSQKVYRWAQDGRRIVTVDSLDSGMGKTYNQEYYAAHNDKVAYVKCTSSMTIRDLLDAILAKMSIRTLVKSPKQKMDLIKEKVTEGGWLLMIDETDDIRMTLWRVIKEIVDFIKNKAGMIVSGMGIIAKIEKLADRRKDGFPQLRRRLMATKFIHQFTKKDQEAILIQYGITNKSAIKWFEQHVSDLQTLSEYIQDALTVSKREGETIDADFLTGLLKNC